MSKARKRELKTWGLALLILLLLVLAVGEAALGRGGARHRAPPDNLQTLDAQTYAAWIAGAGDTPRTASGASGGVHSAGGFHEDGFHYRNGGGSSLTDCANPVSYVGPENRLLEYVDCTTGGTGAGNADSGGSDDLVPAGGDDGGLFRGLFGGGGHPGSGGGGGGGGGFGGGGPGGNFGTFDPPGTIGGHDPGFPPGGDPPPPHGGLGNLSILTVSPVPEPDVWAMLILGFGFVGFSLRRRRALEARAALT